MTEKDIVAEIQAEAAQYAKEIWGSQEPAEDFIKTRKGKRSYDDYIAGRSKTLEERDKEIERLKGDLRKRISEKDFILTEFDKAEDKIREKDNRIKELEEEVTELKKQVEVLRRLSGRKPDTKYTYYKLGLENMSEDWNETICESLDDVRKQLDYLDIHLDDDSETEPGRERKVIITGVGMTPLEFEAWYREAYKIDD